MSETDLQNTSTPKPAETRAEPAPRRSPLAALALLLALVALALGAWSAWQAYHQQQAAEQLESTASGRLAESGERLEAFSRQFDARLAGMPQAAQIDEQRRLLADLQSNQQRLATNLDKVLGASREDWRLAEAEHLLRLAMLRLSAMHDIASAKALLQGADDILKAQHDPLAFAARQALIDALERLRALPEPDREGLYLQLAALREQASGLNALNPNFRPADEDAAAQAETSRWQRWWHKLSGYLRIDLHADQDIRPLLDGQRLAEVRLTLALALEQAQWAALEGQGEVYRTALEQAQQVLGDYFSAENREVAALGQRLGELAEEPVAVEVPDLRPALDALQGYLAQRQRDLGEPAKDAEDAQ